VAAIHLVSTDSLLSRGREGNGGSGGRFRSELAMQSERQSTQKLTFEPRATKARTFLGRVCNLLVALKY
jgi:hypothetical protein